MKGTGAGSVQNARARKQKRKRHTIRALRIGFTLLEKWKPAADRARNWRIGPSKQPVISLGKQAKRNGQSRSVGRAKWNIAELNGDYPPFHRDPPTLCPCFIRTNNTLLHPVNTFPRRMDRLWANQGASRASKTRSLVAKGMLLRSFGVN